MEPNCFKYGRVIPLMRWSDVSDVFSRPESIADSNAKPVDIVAFYVLGFAILGFSVSVLGLLQGDLIPGILAGLILVISIFAVLGGGEAASYIIARLLGGAAGIRKHMYVGSLVSLPFLAAFGLLTLVVGLINYEGDFSLSLDVIMIIFLARSTAAAHSLKDWWKAALVGLAFLGVYIAAAVAFAILAISSGLL